MTAAAARAAHLIVDDAPYIFSDTTAAALLGDQAAELLAYHREHAGHPILSAARGQVTCRSRYTEDRVADAVDRGLTQYVLIGAGLDSFGYRSPLAGRIQVFEVDRAETQEWKRAALAAAGIGIPGSVTLVAADLGTDSLAASLHAAGFNLGRPAVVSWLGVIMYLDLAAIASTLTSIAGFAAGTELIADYMLPQDLRDENGDFYVSQIGPVAAGRGEPWLTFLSPAEIGKLLAESGFSTAEHVRQQDMVPARLWDRSDSLQPISLSMITRATLTGRRRRLTPRCGAGEAQYSRGMQFEARLRTGLHDGSITVAFRQWRRAQVVAGHQYRTGIDMVLAESVDIITPADITAELARDAGFPDVRAAVADLRSDRELPLYCIRFRRLDGPDPRDELAATASVSSEESDAIGARLARMDAVSKRGPWTSAVLAQIADRPGVVSTELAATLCWERADFKLHVRRLKALGLTMSLDVGYRLSPRGAAFLAKSGERHAQIP
jgi:methyltransferase (TIGR00027 family)